MQNDTKIINILELQVRQFIEDIRPDEEIRGQFDIGYSFDNNVVEILEIRSDWQDESKKNRIPIARAKYVKTQGEWTIYWKRANGKWESYTAYPKAKNLEEFFDVLEKDEHNCFWG